MTTRFITALAILLTCPMVAGAATHIVLNTNDVGPGSLRAAVAAAGSGDTIDFDSSLDGATIDLLSGTLPVLDKFLTIDASALTGGLTVNRTNGKAFAVLGREQHDLSGSAASQSSEIESPTLSFPAHMAIDGNTGNFTHTDGSGVDPNPSWEADFTRLLPIDRIVLHNRDDCCQERLADITVTLEDNSNNPIYTSAVLNPGNILGGPPTITLDIPLVTNAASIRVSRAESLLSLAEVEVSYEPAGLTLNGVTVTEGSGNILFVDELGTNAAPFDSIITAAWSLHTAVAAAANGDTILVTAGTHYLSGTLDVSGKAITIQSISGADSTIIEGDTLSRCIDLGSQASCLSGFTITAGYQGGAFGWGGGVACADLTPQVYDCTFRENQAVGGGGMFFGTAHRCRFIENIASIGLGGGMLGGTAYNCLFYKNQSADKGGGAGSATLINCTVVDNIAPLGGGGVANSTATNCIIWGNYLDEARTMPDNLITTTATFSCSPDLTNGVDNNTTADPQFVDPATGNFLLPASSPCVNGGTNAAAVGATDLGGRARIQGTQVEMGAFERLPVVYVSLTGSNTAPYETLATAATTIQDGVDAAAPGDTVFVNDGTYNITSRISLPAMITLESLNGRDVTIIDGGGTTPCIISPSSSTVKGFTVRNGFFDSGVSGEGGGQSGGRAIDCTFSGNYVSGRGGGIENVNAIGCIISNNSSGDLGGGAAYSSLVDCEVRNNDARGGGGLSSCIATNCLIEMNSVGPTSIYPDEPGAGGGILNSAATNCIIRNNNADGGLGGGAFSDYFSRDFAILRRCLIENNRAGDLLLGGTLHRGTAGGVYRATALNCVVSNNFAAEAGGTYGSDCRNSTIVGNSAFSFGGATVLVGHFSFDDTVINNCIIWNNSSLAGPQDNVNGPYDATNLVGVDPLFVNEVGGDYRLTAGSPAIARGNNSRLSFIQFPTGGGDSFEINIDLDHSELPRVIDYFVDVGAYEYQSPVDTDADLMTDGFELLHFGHRTSTLPGDDEDFDSGTNLFEALTGTDPTDGTDLIDFYMSDLGLGTATLRISKVIPGTIYTVKRSTDLGQTDPFAAFPSSSFTVTEEGVDRNVSDTNASGGAMFYQLEVQSE